MSKRQTIGSTRIHTLEEERQVCNHEHKEDTNDTVVDPLECGREVVAAGGAEELAGRRVSAHLQLPIERTQEHHCAQAVSRNRHQT